MSCGLIAAISRSNTFSNCSTDSVLRIGAGPSRSFISAPVIVATLSFLSELMKILRLYSGLLALTLVAIRLEAFREGLARSITALNAYSHAGDALGPI